LKRMLSLVLLAGFLIACEAASTSPSPSDMVWIPAGTFIHGLDPAGELPSFISDRTSSKNAQPQHEMFLDAFYMDIHEVSYVEFLLFKPQAKYPDGRFNQPIRAITWHEADAYCLWLGKRLPTEFEWEKAARGREGLLYTWGNEFQKENANFGKTVQPPGKFPNDVSEFGVYDLNGNVSEWTASGYLPYPGSTFNDASYGKSYKVIRGGAINKREHGFLKEFALLSYRNFAPPQMRSWDTGFRCAQSAPKTSKPAY